MPNNVKRYTRGINDVAARFAEHVSSLGDENGRISDITAPLRKLMVESMNAWLL